MKKDAKKIIICLDIKDGKVSKGVQFENVVSLGDPVEMAENYSKQAVDELVFYDIMASALGKGPNFSLHTKGSRKNKRSTLRWRWCGKY